MSKIIKVESCTRCPYYTEENNVSRGGDVGFVGRCKIQNNKEIDFTSKMDVSDLHEKTHNSCPLENY